MARQSKRVIIIGGGIIGGVSAYYLRQKGWSVTILEKERFGSGASHGNCGLVVPGYSSPLNTPANLIKGLGWMLKKDAPLYIRFQTDAAWVRWMLQFIRHCFGRRHQRTIAGRIPLMNNAVSLFDDLIRAEQIDCDWNLTGTCHLFQSQKAYEDYLDSHGVNPSDDAVLNSSGKNPIRDRVPTVTPKVVGGYQDRQAASIRPDAFMDQLAVVLKGKGVEIVEHTKCFGLDRNNGQAVAARTDQGILKADAFVVATGAWTPTLAQALHCDIPIQPGKGYSVTVKCSDNAPTLPCFLEETRVVVTPWSAGFRLGGTMEFSGLDDSLNPRRLDALFKALEQYMPLAVSNQIEETWCGWRPMTWDGTPVIDYLPGLDNVVVAAGHNELGITMAPTTGQLVAEMIQKEPPHIDPSFYRMDRFAA